MNFSRLAARFAAVLSLALVAAQAQVPQIPLQHPKSSNAAPIPVPPPNPVGPVALTPQDVAAFFDGFLPLQLQRDDVAGATISITQNGQTLLQKGYGYSDWKKKTPVDPVTTTFRPGSISKLFTYVSMMQMVEQGKLDLDTDVNKYLDFTINPGPGAIGNAPITLRNLATHTAGFEEVDHDIGSDKSGKVPVDLRTFLVRDQPHRFAAPGKSLAYSNYGIALIGYIIQRASGEPFVDYVQHHIFTPLGMTHSTFQQPLPAGMSATLGYRSTSKPDTGFEGWTPVPAGALSSTAADMAIFGQMLLGHGAFNGQTILQPQSVALLFTPQFVPAPGLTPWDLGFYDDDRNGLRFIGHGGDLIACHSQFWVETTHNLVFFISYNSSGAGGKARDELFRAFVDRYLPGAPLAHTAVIKLTAKDLAPYAGYYVSSRRSDSTKTRSFNIFDPREVDAHKEGYLTVSTLKDFHGGLSHLQPIGNDSFYDEDAQFILHFERDANGRISGTVSPGHSDRLSLLLTPPWLNSLLGVSTVTLLAIVIAAITRTWRRVFHRRRAVLSAQPGTLWMTRPIQLGAWAFLVLFIFMVVFMMHIADIDTFLKFGHLDGYFMVQNVLAFIAVIALFFGVVSGVRTLRKPLRYITRVKFALATFASAYFIWFSLFFHFIGSTHRY